MTEIRVIYDEIMAYLESTGFGGYVDKLHDYKNGKSITAPTYTDSKTKNVEEAAPIPPRGLLIPIEVTI